VEVSCAGAILLKVLKLLLGLMTWCSIVTSLLAAGGGGLAEEAAWALADLGIPAPSSLFPESRKM
jgi:hypothetical protein